MRCVYLDIETYYDSEYTLKKLSMESYIRDPRFELYLLGVAVDDYPVHMVDAAQVPAALKALALDAPDCITFIQNAKFDASALVWRYGVRIANPVCTRAMARWVGISRLTRESLAAQCEFLGTGVKGDFIQNMQGKRVADLTADEYAAYKLYCTHDVEQLRSNVKKMLPFMTVDALRFIILTTKMYTDLVFDLDRSLLSKYYQQLKDNHRLAQQKLQRLFRFDSPEEFLKAIRSKKKFCEMLESIGGVVPYKESEKKTATKLKQLQLELEALPQGSPEVAAINRTIEEGTYVVMEPALAKKDLAFIELMNSPNPDIAALATARAENNSSISMSRAATFLDVSTRGKLPVPLEAFHAWTGRYAAGSGEDAKSDGLNLQNLAKRTGDKTLRKCVRAPQGYKIVAADSSQIEARTLAWLANENDLLEDFRSGADPYCRMAAVAYSEPYDTILYWAKGAGAKDPDGDPELKAKYKQYRNIGKTMVLQLGYYSGGAKLSLYMMQSGIQLKPTKEEHDAECKRLVQTYRQTNRAIRAFWTICDDVIVQLVNGNTGYFGGPEGKTYYYDGRHQVFGRTVPGILFPDGYWLLYPNLRTSIDENTQRPIYVYDKMEKGRKATVQLHSGVLCNNITQGLAFSLMRWQALLINEKYPVRINIHDAWGVVVKEAEADEAVAYMRKCMKSLPDWANGLPVNCDVEMGDDFTIV